MRLNKPSYGVFMVDIFASSVGIFILVSLLYIIESAKATSDEVMAERFKTLVKRDLIPVDSYGLPASRDPLHDWGVRARHAREKEEALILLLRDKVLLYHTMQTLDKDAIVDSDAIREYYEKYTKNRRLVLEIHYHDAYHYLKAKINESLPPDVRLWIHWAYNAGNIANPNPVLGQDNTNRVNMSRPRPNFNPQEPNSLGIPSSSAANSSTESGSGEIGSEDGRIGEGSFGEGADGSQDGSSEGGDSSSGSGDGQGGGQQGGDMATGEQGQQEGEMADGEMFDPEQQQSPLSADDDTGESPLDKEINRQMEQNAAAQEFIEEYLSPETQEGEQQEQPETEKAQERSESIEQAQSNQSSTTGQGGGEPSDNPESGEPPASQNESKDDAQLSPQMQAKIHIQKNVFISVPMFSPIGHFQLDVQVPGHDHQRFGLNAMQLDLHMQPEKGAKAVNLALAHGDAIVPQSSIDSPGWIKVKIIKVANPEQPLEGWLYGAMMREILMLPLYENKVKSISTQSERYWFKHEEQSIDQYNTNPEGEQ